MPEPADEQLPAYPPFDFGVSCWEDGDGSTCLLLDGHDGPHVFTPDSEIMLRLGLREISDRD